MHFDSNSRAVVRLSHLQDEVLDRGSAEDYAAIAAAAVNAQVEYVREQQVPFWCERLAENGITSGGFSLDAWRSRCGRPTTGTPSRKPWRAP
jgi:hypothetical protein